MALLEREKPQIARRYDFSKWALLLLAGLGFLQAARAFTALFSPVILDYCEMMVGGAAEQLRASWSLGAMYEPPAAPYAMPGVQYPPIFIILSAILTDFSGAPVLLVERLLAWGGYVGAAGLVGLIVWQETRRGWLAIAAAGLPFCFWNVIIFGHAARVDPGALFLSLLAVYLYRRAVLRDKLNLGALLPVSLLCVAAFYTKQTYLAVSAAIFFDLLLKVLPLRKRRGNGGETEKTFSWGQFSTLAYFVGFCVFWLVAFGLTFHFWSGGTFWGIFEPGRAGSFIFDKTPGFVSIFVFNHLPLLTLAGLGLRRAPRFFALYAGFAALMCVTIVKDGAVDYYFNELSYVLSIGVALYVASRQSNHQSSIINHRSILLGVQIIIAIGMFIFWSHWKDFDASEKVYVENLQMVRQAQIEGRPTLIYVNSFLLETGQAAKIGDYFIYFVLLKNDLRDATPLLTDLEAGRYDFVMAESFLRWSPAVDAALARRYDLRTLNAADGKALYRLYIRRP